MGHIYDYKKVSVIKKKPGQGQILQIVESKEIYPLINLLECANLLGYNSTVT